MSISKQKLAKWLHELVAYREADAVHREEFNSYDWKTASEFITKTDEIRLACKELEEKVQCVA